MIQPPPLNTVTKRDLEVQLYSESFYDFVRGMWQTVIPEKPVWNWHIEFVCDELQKVAERVFLREKKEYDLIINIPPASTKSTLASVMFPAWCWVRDPSFRMICGSYAYPLALLLASHCRRVLESEKYQSLFPNVELETDAKGLLMTTKGGLRISTSTGGSITGMHGHCFPWETKIITDRGELPIGHIVDNLLPVHIMGWDVVAGKHVWQKIGQHQKRPARELCRIHFTDGTCLDTTDNHPVFTNHGYVPAENLQPDDEVIHVDQVRLQYPPESGWGVSTMPLHDARKEFSEASAFGKKVVSFVERAVRVSPSVYNLNVIGEHNYFAEGILVHNCILIDDPINPKDAVSDVMLKQTNDWFDHTLLSRMVDKSITPVVLIMQRLHQIDPTGHMLDRRGATPIRHICLPSNLSKMVRPRNKRIFYVNGLFDPVRLPQPVLAGIQAEQGEYAFAGQYGQSPVPMGGGMFKMDKCTTVTTMPEGVTKWIRFWDKAGSQSGSASAKRGAWTVGILMGVTREKRYIIADVIRGQWEASEREKIIKATAVRDGKKVLIGIEQEPGSGGKESAQASVRMLAGWRVRIDRPTGDKELRADPFSTQVNGGNVLLLAGPWNAALIQEYSFFPFSRWKDQVDAGSAAFAMLSKPGMRPGVPF